MKITHIAGSPRKRSNSMKLAERFIKAAEEISAVKKNAVKKNAVSNSYILNNMDFKGCQGCYACKNGKERCVLKDDLAGVLEEIYESDILLISTPVYFWDIPGQLKCFIDRTYSFAKADWQTNPEPSRLPKGKTLVFIQTQGTGAGMHDDIFGKYDTIFKMFAGFSDSFLIKGLELTGKDNVEEREDVIKQVEELAEKIAG